ncbi:3-deoxy-D-manno-octulosonic acid transferase [Pedobacter arcticus]|uniref:3-deoxy-D-manno-octulosonic acid transferase n=1 Tax=Pedobacter arcticus TaxID=752140 RepID=UPI000301A24F|nr:glycosyltransferase N-terminal domain-containing protein [Pedobacter arcticus]
MPIFYNIAIKVYYFLVLLFSFFNKKARLWIDGRKNWERKFSPNVTKKKIWLHFASLGEFEQGKPLLQAIRRDYPEKEIVITFFSPSGYEIRKNSSLGDYILYLPLDTARNAEKFIDLFKPELAIFNKYEYWYHFYKKLHQKQIPVYVTSAIFRPNQIFFKWYGGFNRNILSFVTHFFVQNTESAELLIRIGLNNYTNCGDTRFDSVLDLAKNKKDFPLIEAFKGNTKLIIAGSTWPADEALIAGYIKNLDKNWKMIFAPHEIGEDKIAGLEKLIGNQSVRYSLLVNGTKQLNSSIKCIIIDNIGMLSSLYSYGEIAYIGGGFGVGIHNTLEAAAWGLPVVFGSKYQKFQEAKDLIAVGGGFTITDQEDLDSVFDKLIEQAGFRMEAGEKAKSYVTHNTGATAVIMGRIF